MAGPLAGIKILDLSQFQQGPHAAVLLSDMGADVIKVEPRAGEPSRALAAPPAPGWQAAVRAAYMLAHNRNKRDITIDFTKPAGLDLIYRLAARSDVFMHNFRPGVVERHGLTYQDVRRVNERIVYASASGQGKEGPRARQPAFDLVGQALGGIMVQAGDEGMAPLPAGAAIADQVGSMLLAHGITLALFHRERTGEGQEVEGSLYGAQLTLQTWEITSYLLGGQLPPRAGRGHPLIGGLWQIFPAADGWLAIAGVNDVRWPGFCRALGSEQLQADPRFASAATRVEHRDELVAILDAIFRTKPRAEWLPLLQGADAIVAPVQTYADVVEDPQVLENGFLVEMDHPRHGRIKVVGSPLKLSATPAVAPSPEPELGEHTNEILLELGLSWEDVARLIADEVV